MNNEKNRFFLILAQHTRRRRRRHCALPFETEWISRNSERNEARNYVYVILNRLLKTNWGQHWDAVWRWLNRFLTHCSNENGMYELLRETHSHTHTHARVYVKLLLYVRTWAWNSFIRQTRTNQRTDQSSIMFLFVVVIFFPIQSFGGGVLVAGDGENWHARTRNTACECVCVWSDFLHLFCAQKNNDIVRIVVVIVRIGCILVSD